MACKQEQMRRMLRLRKQTLGLLLAYVMYRIMLALLEPLPVAALSYVVVSPSPEP